MTVSPGAFDDIMQTLKELEVFFDRPYAGPAPDAPETETRTAFHESGHAVVAAALGCAPLRITIVSDGEADGKTTLAHQIPLQERAAYLIAGAVAEVKSHPGINLACVVNCARRDIASLRRLRGDEPLDISAPLSRAGELLAQNWQRVERVAESLLANKTIDTSEMTKVWNDPAPAA